MLFKGFCLIITAYEMPYLSFGLFLVMFCGVWMCFVNHLGSNKLVRYL